MKLRNKPNKLILNSLNGKIRYYFIIVTVLLLYSNSFSQTSTIVVEVNWPSWSSENRVTFRDNTDTAITNPNNPICNPTTCFVGGTNNAYSTTVTFLSVPWGTDYDILLEDIFGDGWNGGTSYVRVFQDGTQIIDTDLAGTSTIVSFDILPPPLIITDGVTDTSCSNSFYDSGGSGSNYSINQDLTYTICPDTPGQAVTINFNSFSLENGFDFLSIYEGSSTFGTLLGTYTGTTIPPSFTSSDASGCLTFRFTSDFSITASGWGATISCSAQPQGLYIDDVTVAETAATATFNVTYTGPTLGSGFTVDYATTDGTAFSGSDYTSTSGTLNFSGATGQILTVTVPIIDDSFGEDTEGFQVNLSNISTGSVTIADSLGIGQITDTDPALPTNVPLTLFDQFNGYIDYTTAGGTLRADDNTVDPCSINTTSTGDITEPVIAGATIEKAYLFWSNSGASADTQVSLDGQTIDATIINKSTIGALSFYGMVSDVTTLVAGTVNLNSHTFTFTDLSIDNTTDYCNGTVVLGGWSLAIFYAEPTLTASSINLYNGFSPEQNSSTSYALSGFYAIGPTEAKTSVLSWEGDPDLNNSEDLTSTTSLGTVINLRGDGDNDGSPTVNPFNSTIYNDVPTTPFEDTTTHGVDFDTYDISSGIVQGDNSVTTTVQSGTDYIILNSVILKVPSNLIIGTVFEDVNYGGGNGRDLAASSGVVLPGVTVELYDMSNALVDTQITDVNGEYVFGGIPDDTYSVRVVNSTVASSRPGGSSCATCLPVQTYRRDYATGSGFTEITTEVGGANPSSADTGVGVLAGAQTVSTILINADGAAGLDFGFNFNSIVNTNDAGQGSLRQFMINSNNLTGNSLLTQQGLTASRETSIFMIPSSTDPLGRTTDPNFSAGVAMITLSSALTTITDDDTYIDGSTQTNNIGDTNVGSVGTGGTVGVDVEPLPTYQLPEIAINGGGNVAITINGDASDILITNLDIYNANIGVSAPGNGGSGVNRVISEMLLGVLPDGGDPGVALRNDQYGVQVQSPAELTVTSSYIGWNGNGGILGIASTSVLQATFNEVFQNGWDSDSHDGIDMDGINGTVQNNLVYAQQTSTGLPSSGGGSGIELGSKSVGVGNNLVDNNTIFNNTSAGINIRKGPSGNTISKNIIYENEVGIAVNDEGRLPTNANFLTQNSTYNNTGLGIDLFGGGTGNFDGITLNDLDDLDIGSNDLVNFPIFESIYITGVTNLTIKGWSRPGATIELFLTDISEGTATAGDNQLGLTQDYGEGQTYLATVIEGSGSDNALGSSAYTDPDGNTDTTNEFEFTIVIPGGVSASDLLTATATVANSTSEFSPTVVIEAEADLSLQKTVDNSSPNQGDTITFTLTVNNDGPSSPTSIIVKDIIPADFTYTHPNFSTTQGTVTFNAGTREFEWDLDTFVLGTGNSITLEYTVTVEVCGEFTNQAEITNSSLPDPDSTPNNGG